MASVNVLCPNGRRQNVKVTPNTRVIQIIETVCAKQGFNPAEYNLKLHRSIVDAQLPFRFTNIPNNAKLEMVKAEVARIDAPTQIALQLASGERLQHKFPTSTSLWDVLKHWEEQPESIHKGELMASKTDNEGQVLHPICIYMQQQIIGEAALKSTSLHTLGLSGGRALIRLIHRAVELPEPPPPPVQKVERKPAPNSTQSKPVSNNTPTTSHGVTDNASATNMREQGQEENKMEVDSTSRKSPSSNSGESVMPMDVDTSSSSEGVATSSGRALMSRDMGARPKNQGQGFMLSAEQERLANDMGAAMAEAIMQQRAAALASQIVPQIRPFADFKFPDPVGSSSSSKQEEQHEEIKPCERLPLVYNPKLDIPAELQTNEDLPESFFDVSVADVRRMYSELRNQNMQMGEQHLETKSMRDARQRREMQRYPKVVIRIHFPDNLILQGFFRPQETVGAIIEFVKSHLEEPSCKFYLYTTPPKMVFKDFKQNLYAAKLCPAAVVHFGCSSEKDHHLSESARSQIETLLKADELVSQNLEKPSRGHPASTSHGRNLDIAGPSTSAGASTSGMASGGLDVPAAPRTRRPQGASAAEPSGKVPKWFKVGKK